MHPADSGYMYVKREDAGLRTVEPPSHWQSIWFQARRRPWHTLAVIPVQDDGEGSLVAAKALQMVGRLVEGTAPTVVDGTGLGLAEAKDLLAALEVPGKPATRILAVDCPLDRPSAIALARAADAALLLVDMGRTTITRAQKVLELVGRERFVGTIGAPSDGLHGDEPDGFRA